MKKVYYFLLIASLFIAPSLKAQISGDYESNGNVTVSLTSATNWLTYSGGSWVTASSAPLSTVSSGNTITILSAATWTNTATAVIPVGVTLLFQGTTGTMGGTLTINGTYIHESASAGSNVFAIINATTGLGSSSTVDYRATSTLTVGAPKFSGITFNNLIFDTDPNTPPSTAPSISPGISSAVTINGKLTVSSWTLNFSSSTYAINLNGSVTIAGTSTLAGQLEVIAATIASGDTLNVSNSYATLQIAASKTVTINGVFVNSNTGTAVTYNSSSALVINGTYDYNINGGTLSTSANLTYSSGCTIAITGVTSTMPTFPASFATGANVLWNCPSQSAALNFTNATQTINGNFTVQSTGTKYIYLGGGGTARTMNITGNLIVNGGQFDAINPSGSGTTVSQTCNVTGNVTVSSGALYAADATNGATGYSSVYGYLNIGGSLNHTGGNFGSSTYTTVAGTGVVTFNTTTAGNTISSIGLTAANIDSIIINTSTATITLNSVIAVQKLTLTSGTLALASGVNLILSGTSLSRTSGVIQANGTNDSITLAAAVTIPSGTFSPATVTNLEDSNAAPTLNQAITVSNSFTLLNKSAASYTFTTNGNLTLASGATYIYNKSTTLSTYGMSLSVTPTYAGTVNFTYLGTQSLTVGVDVTSTASNVINTLTINNTGTISLNSSITIQNLVLTNGSLNLGSSVNLTINGSTVSRTSGTLTANGTSVIITLGGSATIPASTFSPTTVTALVVNNSATAKLNQSITVPSLTLTSGSLTLGNGVNLTLSSSLIVTSGILVANAANDSITLTAGITIPSATFSPATVTNLVISNAAPTLNQAITVSSSLTLISSTSSSYGIVNGSNLTIGSGASYTYNKTSTGAVGLSSAPTYAGTANFNYLGTSALTIGNEAPSTSGVINNLTINNTGGVSLNQSKNATVNGTLTLTSGSLLLGSSNLTLAGVTTVAGSPSASNYIQTTSTGVYTVNSIGSGTVVLPIGTSSYYVPLSLSGTTNTPNVSVKVQSTLTHTPVSPNNVVNIQWSILSSAASTSSVTFQYNTANEGSSFANTGAILGIYTTSYTQSSLGSVSGANPYTITATSLSLPTSTSLYAVGNNYAFAAPPGAPTSVTAVDGDGQATISFTAPSSNGGDAITSYTVTSSPGSFTNSGSTSPITVTGLTDGISYTFTVTATNIIGTGSPSSASNAVIPSSTTTWNGTTWNAGIPTSVSTAIVAGKLTNAQWGGATSVVKLTVNSLDTFALTGTISVTGSTFTDNGTISGGTIILAGSSAQTIAGTGLVNNFTLNTSNGATVTSGSNNLGITGVLTLQSGLLTTNGNVTFKSTSITNTGILAPVGTSGNSGSITGNVTVERYIPMGYRAYRDMAPEVYGAGSIFNNWQEGGANTTTGIFITGTSAADPTDAQFSGTATSYNPTPNSSGLDYSPNGIASAFNYINGTWNTGITNTKTTNLDAFQGYRVLVRGARDFNLYLTPIVSYQNGLRMHDATTIRAIGGQLVTGNVSYSTTGVTNTATGGSTYTLNSASGGFSLVANPYVCPVLWGTGTATNGSNTVYGNSSNINGSFWYLDPTHNATGSYVAYNALSGSVYSDETYATGYIQPGLAFFIQSTSSSPTVVFTESTKAASSTKLSVFGAANPLSKIYVSLLVQANGSYTRTNGTAVAFNGAFGNTYGPQDALKFGNASDNIYIGDKGKSLSIDGRLPATASDAVALRIGQPSGATYQLQIDATAYINDGFAPLLYDAYKNTTTALGSGVTTIDFTIDINTAATYAERFTIIFTPSALAVNSIVASATLNNKVATITWNTVGEKGESYYEVEKSTDARTFTSIGQQTAKNTTTASYSATDNNISSGNTYYRIKAVSEVGTVSYSNVAKVQLSVNSNQFTVYPNPLVGKTLNVALANVVAGKYVVSIYNLLGEKVNEQTISHAGGSGSHALLINNILASGIYSMVIREETSGQLVYQTNLSVQK